jgi:NAD(P)-dependent dehydrogenase (short-subunit alcohol dehydrogenase family)
MSERFDDKVALITGGASGIGKAVAAQLAAAGAKVVVVDLNEDAAQAAVEEITSIGGQAVAIAADVGDPAQVRTAVAAAVETYGALHAALNNAGMAWWRSPPPRRTRPRSTQWRV